MRARRLRILIYAAALVSLACGPAVPSVSGAGTPPLGYIVSLHGTTSDRRHVLNIDAVPSNGQVQLSLFLSSAYPSRSNATDTTDDSSFVFNLPRGDLQRHVNAFVLDTHAHLGRYGRLSATWSVHSLPTSPALSASNAQTCTLTTALTPRSVPATATAALALTLPDTGPVTGTVYDPRAAVLALDTLSAVATLATLVRGGGATASPLPHNPSLRRLGAGVEVVSLEARTTVGATQLSVSIEGRRDYPGIAIRVGAEVTPSHDPLVVEQHSVHDLLTTGNSVFHVGADLTANLRYHGPFGSADLTFRPKLVTSGLVAGHGSNYKDLCGKRYTVPTEPDRLVTAGSAVVSGSVSLLSGPVHQARLGVGDTATVELDRRGPTVLRLLAISPRDEATGVPLQPQIRLAFNQEPPPGVPLIYLCADGKPDPIPLTAPRYDPATHALTVAPRTPLRPRTLFTVDEGGDVQETKGRTRTRPGGIIIFDAGV